MLLISWESDRNLNEHIITEVFIEMHKILKSYHVIYQMKAKTILCLIMMKMKYLIFELIQILGSLPYYEFTKSSWSSNREWFFINSGESEYYHLRWSLQIFIFRIKSFSSSLISYLLRTIMFCSALCKSRWRRKNENSLILNNLY